jgi:IclR family KDG regulon transcriptional repressor
MSKAPVANHTLMNGLRVLEYVSARYREVSVSELAEALDLPKSHVHRLLRSLVTAGYVTQSPDTRKYCADYRLLALAGPFAESLPLRRVAGPALRDLAETTQASCYIGVLHKGAPLVIMAEHPTTSGRPAQSVPWSVLSRHASAFGKLFLALKNLPVEEAELKRITPLTIRTLRVLKAELAAIRKQGYAVNRRENGESYSFAAPIRGQISGLLGAVGLALPVEPVERRGEGFFIRQVLDAARVISAQATDL